jgi:hypothetical protein
MSANHSERKGAEIIKSLSLNPASPLAKIVLHCCTVLCRIIRDSGERWVAHCKAPIAWRAQGERCPVRGVFSLQTKQWPTIKSVHARRPNHERYRMPFPPREAARGGSRVAGIAAPRVHRGIDNGIASSTWCKRLARARGITAGGALVAASGIRPARSSRYRH